MMDLELTAGDREQLAAAGISEDEARRQVGLLRQPPPAIRLARPCTLGDGIERLAEADQGRYLRLASQAAAAGRVTKLVPASGAASRMFQGLQKLREGGGASADDERFFTQLPSLPLAGEVFSRVDPRADRRQILDALLGESGLDLGRQPKALIPFHPGESGPATAFEEHLAEALAYALDEGGRARVHFTVQADHQEAFENLLAGARDRWEASGQSIEVSFSQQHPATDTLALDDSGQPFRQADGRLLLRPGGHGALIVNLADLGGDLVSIKNIDNVVPAKQSGLVVHWKRLLLGRLAELQERAFGALEALDAGDHRLATEVVAHDLGQQAPADPEAMRQRLDRPLRVCGVVRNQGEPGGGPYWVQGSDGHTSLQLVEASQVADDQKHLIAEGTHFNPVDLACAVRDRHGRPFDLERFIDPATAFVAPKSHQGRTLTALERPGLWNGAMAGWNTIFVEVPLKTFAPVKTVYDLLRPEHSGSRAEAP